jgi:hypothetical protein
MGLGMGLNQGSVFCLICVCGRVFGGSYLLVGSAESCRGLWLWLW